MRCSKPAVADGWCVIHHPLRDERRLLDHRSKNWRWRLHCFWTQIAIAALLQFIIKVGPQYTFKQW